MSSEQAFPVPVGYLRREGAAIATGAGGGAAYAHLWSGQSNATLLTLTICISVACLLGALTWPIFQPPVPKRSGPGFAAVFVATIGIMAGAFAAFPLGAFGGAVSGLAAGALGLWVGRKWAFKWGALASLASALALVALVLR